MRPRVDSTYLMMNLQKRYVRCVREWWYLSKNKHKKINKRNANNKNNKVQVPWKLENPTHHPPLQPQMFCFVGHVICSKSIIWVELTFSSAKCTKSIDPTSCQKVNVGPFTPKKNKALLYFVFQEKKINKN
jgi:hypothetical protein